MTFGAYISHQKSVAFSLDLAYVSNNARLTYCSYQMAGVGCCHILFVNRKFPLNRDGIRLSKRQRMEFLLTFQHSIAIQLAVERKRFSVVKINFIRVQIAQIIRSRTISLCNQYFLISFHSFLSVRFVTKLSGTTFL